MHTLTVDKAVLTNYDVVQGCKNPFFKSPTWWVSLGFGG